MKTRKKVKLNAPGKSQSPRELSATERVDRLELLSHAEALLMQALSHAMYLGFGGELNWPVLIARPDNTRVHVLEQAVDLAAERLVELCKQIETEILELSVLPGRTIYDRYKVIHPRSKEHPRPTEVLHPADNNVSTCDGKRSPAQHSPVASPAMPNNYNPDELI